MQCEKAAVKILRPLLTFGITVTKIEITLEFFWSHVWLYLRVDKMFLGYKYKFFMNNRIPPKSHRLYNGRKEENIYLHT